MIHVKTYKPYVRKLILRWLGTILMWLLQQQLTMQLLAKQKMISHGFIVILSSLSLAYSTKP